MTEPNPAYLWLASVLRGESPYDVDFHDELSVENIWQAGLENGVLSLLYYTLNQSGSSPTIPDELEQKLHQHALSAAAAELKTAQELREVFSAFATNHLKCLLIKGAPLAYSLYPQPYLRSRCDTDLIFQTSSEAEKAWDILKVLDYKRPNAVQGKYVSHEFSCFRTDTTNTLYTLDLHWRLSNAHLFAGALDYTELAEGSIQVTELDERAWGISNTHALLLALSLIHI